MKRRTSNFMMGLFVALLLITSTMAFPATALAATGDTGTDLDYSWRELADGTVREVIMATNADLEGEATAMYIARLIKPLGIAVTRLAQGIQVGGDLEYADEVTLARALDGRREM